MTTSDSRVARATPPRVPAVGVVGEPGHPGLVAQDAAAAAGGGRVDSQHGDAVPPVDQPAAEGVDEGRLAHAGNAGDADPPGPVGVRQQPVQHMLGQHPVIGAARLHQRDRAGDARPRSGQHRIGVPANIRRHGVG
jgi:hypothetical protein